MSASSLFDARAAMRLVAGAAVATATVLLLFAVSSDQPLQAAGDLLTGALSSPGRITQWLGYSSFLMFTGASVCLAFRVGMFSIGAEGQVFVGALCGGLVVLTWDAGAFAVPAAIAAAVLGGCVWGLVPGLMKAYLHVDEIVTTLMLNYIGAFLFAFVVKQYLQPEGAGYPVSEFIDPDNWLPTLGSNPRVPSTIILGLAVCVGASLLLNRSRLGFKLRVVGDSQPFAAANGLPVKRLICLAFVVSGGIAGAAGAAIALGSTHRLILGMATGIGFDGILVALLAANRPALVPLTALAYGYLRTGGDVIQITSNVPRDVVVVLQGLLIIGLAAALRRRESSRRRGSAQLAEAPEGAVQAPPGATRNAGAQSEVTHASEAVPAGAPDRSGSAKPPQLGDIGTVAAERRPDLRRNHTGRP